MSSTETVSWRAVLNGPNAGMFAVLSFGVWLHAADSTVVATLMPSVVFDIGGAELISWNYMLYELASIAAACCGALVARRFGLRRAMIWSAVAFGLGCAISAVTPIMGGMLLGRAIQGAGGGLLVALTMIGASSLFPSHYAPRVMAAISAVWGASAFVGPLIGGFFAEYSDWRYGFWAFVVQSGALALALRLALPASLEAGDETARIPWRRLAVLSASVLAVAVAGLKDTFSMQSAGMCLFGLLGLILFLRLDGRAGNDRLLPRAIGDIRAPAWSGLTGVFLLAVVTTPFVVYGPVLLSILHGIGPIAAGYMVALESVAWTVGALAFSGAVGASQQRVIRYSFIGVAVGCAGLSIFVASGPIWLLLPLLFLQGMGFGACFGHILHRCVDLVPQDDKDRAASALSSIQTFGYALGAAVIGLIANAVGFGVDPGPATAGAASHWVFGAMVPVALIAVLTIRLLPQTNPTPHAPEGAA